MPPGFGFQLPFQLPTPSPSPEPLEVSPNDAYHTFFDLFCDLSRDLTMRYHTATFRDLLLKAFKNGVLDLTESELMMINSGSTRQICQWMRSKQRERARDCCRNQIEPFTGQPTRDIPLLFLYRTRDGNCIDLIHLRSFLLVGNKSPLTDVPFEPEEREAIIAKYDLVAGLMITLRDILEGHTQL